jgi:hypothetical protein
MMPKEHAIYNCSTNTTVVNKDGVWHHALFDEGGNDAADGGPEDAEIVDRRTGGGR